MAGTIGYSLSQQFDALGNPLSGGFLYFRQAGTVATPQNAFQDVALTIPHPNPIVLSPGGRIPQFYLADGSIKIVLTDRHGDTQVTADNILVVGPSGGGGGGGGVDPTTVFSAGDVKSAYGTSVLTGWVRANGRNIGSATSGATERANADTQTLFVYLYGADPSLAVSGGRGASAAADFAANKTIDLPDFRGRVLAGFDDMGNSIAGRLTGTTMTGTGIGGVSTATQTKTLAAANLPPYTPAGTLSLSNGAVTITNGAITVTNGAISASSVSTNTGANGGATNGVSVGTATGNQNLTSVIGITQATTTASQLTTTASQAASSGTFLGTAAAGQISTAFSIVQPTIFVTTYIKL